MRREIEAVVKTMLVASVGFGSAVCVREALGSHLNFLEANVQYKYHGLYDPTPGNKFNQDTVLAVSKVWLAKGVDPETYPGCPQTATLSGRPVINGYLVEGSCKLVR